MHRLLLTDVQICHLFLCGEIETLVESVNTSAGIDELLLTCEVGMAVGANINTHVGLCGTGFDYSTASALDCGLFVLGMNTLFHSFHLFRYCGKFVGYFITHKKKKQEFFKKNI